MKTRLRTLYNHFKSKLRFLRYKGKQKQFDGSSINTMATANDIYYCYKLILGRNPDLEGWSFYASQIERTKTAQLASYFLKSPEFKRRGIFQPAPEQKPVLVDLDTFKIYVSPQDTAVGKPIIDQQIHEPHVTKALQTILKPQMVFIDIGANIGYFSLLAAQKVGPSGKVLAFEPHQYNCGLLALSARANHFRNIQIYPLAVADKATTFLFDQFEGSNGAISEEIDSEIDDNYINMLANRTLVTAVKLDDLLQGIERIDVIKIDIEGAEYRAISGAENLIQKHRPLIVSEFSPGLLRSVSQISEADYLGLLIQKRYHLSILEENGNLIECGANIEKLLNYFAEQAQKGNDHIDILAHLSGRNPLAQGPH